MQKPSIDWSQLTKLSYKSLIRKNINKDIKVNLKKDSHFACSFSFASFLRDCFNQTNLFSGLIRVHLLAKKIAIEIYIRFNRAASSKWWA